ncbi:hypothetical protein [Streptomyces sp. NBC_00328]|uniref:hypothetical protein n=1 Tax=Streptomyces sp. NBC_00328 TaxID=2903646 RepID=UPI002E2B4581|nr:hypothetical protein [Streptomyces sp. NBC_00328]
MLDLNDTADPIENYLAAPRLLEDPRVGPSATYDWDWLPGVHERRLQYLARRSEPDR